MIAPAYAAAAPRVTVIIPTYERAAFLEEALHSVLRQTRPVDEIVVVDDCSGIVAWREAQRLAALSRRVKLHRMDAHSGAAAARNRGLDAASGDVVLFLDDDDLLEPRMVERSLLLLDADARLDVVVCRSAIHHIPGSQRAFRVEPPPRRTWERRPGSAILRRSSPINSFLARRNAIGNTRFPEDLAYGEDKYFWLMIARNGRRFTLRPEPDAVVRRHAGNTTRSRSTARKGSQLALEKLVAEQPPAVPDEHVLIFLKLAYWEWIAGNGVWRAHLARACRYPLLVLREFLGYTARGVGDPIGFVRHYLL